MSAVPSSRNESEMLLLTSGNQAAVLKYLVLYLMRNKSGELGPDLKMPLHMVVTGLHSEFMKDLEKLSVIRYSTTY
jgi:hypothetical protein